MELELIGNLIVKCNQCGEEYCIDVDALSEDICITERNINYNQSLKGSR